MEKVTVTRTGRKKRDQSSSPSDLQNGEFGDPMAAIFGAPPNTQLSNAPELLRATLPRNRGEVDRYYLCLGLEIKYHTIHY